jgi:hypothetical protein
MCRLDTDNKHHVPIVLDLQGLINEYADLTSSATDKLSVIIEDREPYAGFKLLEEVRRGASRAENDYEEIRPHGERWAHAMPFWARQELEQEHESEQDTVGHAGSDSDEAPLSNRVAPLSPINAGRLFKRPSAASPPPVRKRTRKAPNNQANEW